MVDYKYMNKEDLIEISYRTSKKIEIRTLELRVFYSKKYIYGTSCVGNGRLQQKWDIYEKGEKKEEWRDVSVVMETGR